MKKRRVFDETFKRMAIELSHAKGSVQEAARELGIDSSRITEWRQTRKSPSQLATTTGSIQHSYEMFYQANSDGKTTRIELTESLH